MDPITIIVFALIAIVFLIGLVWTWEIFGGLLQIIVVFTVLGLAIGLLTDPNTTMLEIINGVKSLVDFAHQIRNAVTH